MSEIERLRAEAVAHELAAASFSQTAAATIRSLTQQLAAAEAKVARVQELVATPFLCETASNDATHYAVPVEHLRAVLAGQGGESGEGA